jgi:hypothetical protein
MDSGEPFSKKNLQNECTEEISRRNLENELLVDPTFMLLSHQHMLGRRC